MTSKHFWKSVTIRAAFISAAISLIVSGISSCINYNLVNESNRLSKESNELSRKALEISKSSFVSGQRPYIVLEPDKFEKTNKFINIISDEKTFEIQVKYRIANEGKSLAKDISLPIGAIISTAGVKNQVVPINMGVEPSITLAPGEEYAIVSGPWFEMDKLSIEKSIKNLNSGGSIDIEMILTYKGEFDTDGKYKTEVKHSIFMDHFALRKLKLE